jgi:hypothetical protein
VRLEECGLILRKHGNALAVSHAETVQHVREAVHAIEKLRIRPPDVAVDHGDLLAEDVGGTFEKIDRAKPPLVDRRARLVEYARHLETIGASEEARLRNTNLKRDEHVRFGSWGLAWRLVLAEGLAVA